MAKTDIKFAPLETNTDYATYKSQIAARRKERTELRVELNSILERIRSGNDKPLDGNGEAERVAAIAAGKAPPDKARDELRLGDLTKKIRELDSAIDYLAAKMQGAANIHSVAVCDSLRKQHDSLAVEIFDSVVAARESAQSYKSFLGTLTDAGINVWHFPQNVNPSFLQASDKFGHMASWFDQMATAGIVSRSKIPDGMDFRK